MFSLGQVQNGSKHKKIMGQKPNIGGFKNSQGEKNPDFDPNLFSSLSLIAFSYLFILFVVSSKG